MDCLDTSCFAQSVQERFLCPICSDVMVNPVQGACQHEFGNTCIKQWLVRDSSCPICKRSITIGTLSPARLMRELVAELPLWCKHRRHGCEAVTNLNSHQAHLRDNCFFMECTMESCSEVMRRSELDSHLAICKHNPGAHDARMKALEQHQQDMQVLLFENLKSGVSEPLRQVQRRLGQNKTRIQTIEASLDEISIPRSDDSARKKRKELLNALGNTESAIEKLEASIKAFVSHN